MIDAAFRPARGWGPAGRRAALSITFDNLGEAAELELGLWGNQPVGCHHTASFVPQLIAALGDIRATYFIEASNVALYPETIKAWARAGHEVGIHAWRHEAWGRCSSDTRRELLRKSLAAMGSLGIDVVGFRPPGGVIPPEAWTEFEEAGLLYCSELGDPEVVRVGEMVSVPFEWRAVDVYMIEEVMDFMRLKNGDPEAPFPLTKWQMQLDEMLETAIETRGHRTVVFHPNFLGTSQSKMGVLTHLIEAAKSMDVWIAPVREVADFVVSRTRGEKAPGISTSTEGTLQ